jgi:hypothetical protein
MLQFGFGDTGQKRVHGHGSYSFLARGFPSEPFRGQIVLADARAGRLLASAKSYA